MKRLLQAFVLFSLGAALLGCGPAKKSVYPPSVSIQQLQVQPDGPWTLTLRIQNNSYGEMDFRSLDGQLQIAQGVPIRLHARFERNIPELAGDVLPLQILPTTAMRQTIAAAASKGSGGSVAYRVSGSMTAQPEQEKTPRNFDFSGSQWLSPVPGIPNTWR